MNAQGELYEVDYLHEARKLAARAAIRKFYNNERVEVSADDVHDFAVAHLGKKKVGAIFKVRGLFIPTGYTNSEMESCKGHAIRVYSVDIEKAKTFINSL